MNAIVDVQGFKMENNEFIVKEVAIALQNRILVLLIKPPYPFYDLTRKERLQVSWIERNRNIFWNSGFVPYLSFKQYIEPYLQDKHIYVKGCEKVSWLRNIVTHDKVYNLEDKNCPSFQKLFDDYGMCNNIFSCVYHSNVCALKNVTCLKLWIENKRIFN